MFLNLGTKTLRITKHVTPTLLLLQPVPIAYNVCGQRIIHSKSSLWPPSFPAIFSNSAFHSRQLPFEFHIKNFHTSSRLYAIPLFWVVLKPFIKLLAILSGRKLRYWLRKDPKNKALVLTGLKKNRRWFLKFGIVFTLYGIYFYWSHLQEAPITHRKRFIAFTPEQFKKISKFESEAQIALFKDKIIRTDHPYYHLVIDVLQRLFNANADIPQLKKLSNWSVSIIDDNAKNAFVLPNGQIFVFTGMLKIIENPDQLGIVLAHEMSHALLGHAIELVSYAQIIDVFIVVAMTALWAILPSDGVAAVTQWFYQKVVDIILQMPYNRKLEKEADYVGLELASKACFDVREAVNFWRIMDLEQSKSKSLERPPPEWLSTHPASIKRAESLNEMIPRALELRKECHCPNLPTRDPRIRRYSI